jgi:hypothetical protein
LPHAIVTQLERAQADARGSETAMSGLSRRATLGAVGAVVGVQFLARVASATLVRGMSLPELVSRSRHVVIATPLEARCSYLSIGGRNRLITETRLRIEGGLGLEPAGELELAVRTLGGVLDGVGELVHGQAEFQRNRLCVGFLTRAPDGACWVTGMAQGHYPLEDDGAGLVLRASPQLPTIRDWEQSAVRRLVGARLAQAEGLIAQAKPR